MSLWSFIGRRAARITLAYREEIDAAYANLPSPGAIEPDLPARWPDEKIPVAVFGARTVEVGPTENWTPWKARGFARHTIPDVPRGTPVDIGTLDPDLAERLGTPEAHTEQAAAARDTAGTVPPSDESADPADGERAAADVANHGGDDEVGDQDVNCRHDPEAGEGVALPDDPASDADEIDVGIHPAPPEPEHPLVVAMRERFLPDDRLDALFAEGDYEGIVDVLSLRFDTAATMLDNADAANRRLREQMTAAPAGPVFPDDVRALLDAMIADTGRSENDLIVGMVGDILRDDAAAHEDEDEDDERDDRARRDLDAAGIKIRGTVPVSPPLDGEITPPPQPIDYDKRNREIIAMAQKGIAPKQLAEHFQLSGANVRLILRAARETGAQIPRFSTSGRPIWPEGHAPDDVTDVDAAE